MAAARASCALPSPSASHWRAPGCAQHPVAAPTAPLGHSRRDSNGARAPPPLPVATPASSGLPSVAYYHHLTRRGHATRKSPLVPLFLPPVAESILAHLRRPRTSIPAMLRPSPEPAIVTIACATPARTHRSKPLAWRPYVAFFRPTPPRRRRCNVCRWRVTTTADVAARGHRLGH